MLYKIIWFVIFPALIFLSQLHAKQSAQRGLGFLASLVFCAGLSILGVFEPLIFGRERVGHGFPIILSIIPLIFFALLGLAALGSGVALFIASSKNPTKPATSKSGSTSQGFIWGIALVTQFAVAFGLGVSRYALTSRSLGGVRSELENFGRATCIATGFLAAELIIFITFVFGLLRYDGEWTKLKKPLEFLGLAALCRFVYGVTLIWMQEISQPIQDGYQITLMIYFVWAVNSDLKSSRSALTPVKSVAKDSGGSDV